MEKIFIVTSELDPNSFAWLNALRQAYFPPRRNLIVAHLSMFHRISAAQICRLRELTLPNTPLSVTFESLMSFGSGVAVRVRSPRLEAVRETIRRKMGDELSPQDAQRWIPHVTIQNKVAREQAESLYKAMGSTFDKRSGSATGLLIWEYLGGPWKEFDRLPFA